MATRKKAVAKKSDTTTALALPNFEQYADAGWSNVDESDVRTPQLRLLQPGSPEVQAEEGDERYIAGAKAGVWLNEGTGEVHESVNVCPVYIEKNYAEWPPSDDDDATGGAPIARHDVDSEIVKAALAKNGGSPVGLKTEDGNDLRFNYILFLLVLDESGENVVTPAVTYVKSTHISPFKRHFTSKLRMVKGAARAPMFVHRVKFGAQRKQEGKYTWYLPTFAPVEGSNYADSMVRADNEAHMAIFETAGEFYKQVQSGDVKAAEDVRETKADEEDAF